MNAKTSSFSRMFRRFERLKIPEWFLLLLISFILGIVWYLVLYGRFPLYFTHVNWIYSTGRDPLQHQLGWEFFRNEPWRFPLGSISSYGYPIGTTVTFMDSIPIYAYIFKLLSPLLDKNFQYLGIWELNSIIAQLFAGLLILREFSKSKIIMILGSSLLVLSPPLIYRAFFHSSLSAQWIILLAVLFVILEYRNKMKLWYWLLLFTLAMLIHLYFIPMILPIWGISLVFRFSREKKKRLVLIEPVKVLGVLLLTGYCTGLFGLNFNDLSLPGFGDYSWNLNGFVNSFGFSKIIPPLSYVRSQEEGFSYLGVGNFLLLTVGIICFFVKDTARKNWKFFLPFVLVSIIFMAYSLSNYAAFNKFILWDFHLQESTLEIVELFRSSGRFIWPVYYFIVLFGIISLIRNGRFVIPILIIALVLQFYDLSPLYQSKQLSGFREYAPKMDAEFWSQAGKSNDHLVVIPYEYYETLAVFAVRHDMTINAGYFGRTDYGEINDYTLDTWNDLLEGQMDDRTIYILSELSYLEKNKMELPSQMYICSIDNYNLAFSFDNELSKMNVLKSFDCSIPASLQVNATD